MRSTFALMSALMGVASAVPQAVTDVIAPTASPSAGCKSSMDGSFEISIAQVTKAKRGLVEIEKRGECGANGILVMTLKDGELADSQDRTGYVASNFQFQFDGPPQAGALFTSGFSVCPGNLLALGDSTTFYRCLSGDFYNLYDRSWAEQCEPVSIVAVPCGSGSGAGASQIGDGQVVGTSVVQTTIVTALSDGQPQVVTTGLPVPLCQIGDGQVQVQTTPCDSISAVPTTSYAPVSESSDGQIIATAPVATAAPSVPMTSAVTSAVPMPTVVPSGAFPIPSSNSTMTTSKAASSSAASPTPSAPASTSAPPASGSSTVTAGSLSALVVGMLVAVICL